MKIRFVTIAFALGLAVPSLQSQVIKKVYFIGNSYTAFNDLPGMTQQLAKSQGDTFEVGSRSPGGMNFYGHSSAPDLFQELRTGHYDAVVLQEQSQLPAFPISQVESDCFPYAKLLVDSIRAIQPACKIVFYTTWGRQNGDQQNCATWKPVCTFKGMNELLRQRYQQMAKDNQCKAAPIASVWRDLRDSTNLQLYQPDGSHPSFQGSAIAAATLYATLFEKSIDISADLPMLTQNEKQQILSTVNAIIQDSLTYYNFEQSAGLHKTPQRPLAVSTQFVTPEKPWIVLPKNTQGNTANETQWGIYNSAGILIHSDLKNNHMYPLNMDIPVYYLSPGWYQFKSAQGIDIPFLIVK